ncbi:helix-turn-helix domain-containing protein [Actinomycetota bacterium]
MFDFNYYKMNKNEFSNTRKLLGKTQKEMAELLCISIKAVQSYEQGWRQIQPHHEQQMLLLLSLKSFTDRNIKPCWEINDCLAEWRDNCIVWELKARHFCWFINGTYCNGKAHKNWDDKIKICRECEVYMSMLPDI